MINVITLCSGYDSQCMARDEIKKTRPGFDYNLVAWSEIDKYAIKVHDALYPQWADRNVGDMTTADWSKFEGTPIDLLTYSTPCTDISAAGYQKGLEEGSGTRSSILWSTRNAIIALRPKYLLLENVKQLVSKKFLPYFKKWLQELEGYGYHTTYKVLNSTGFGVPQNRERVFAVSVRNDVAEESDYEFPEPRPLTLHVEDLLEKEVDEKYYLNNEQVNKFVKLIHA